MSRSWVVLVYKVAPEPSANRVSVWRKLKRLGALLLHDAVWVLPAHARSREQFQWLAVEIRDLGGQALVWEGQSQLLGQDDSLVQQFLAQVEPGYQELLTALGQAGADVEALARRYQQLLAQDHCQSPLAEQVRAALIAAREGAEA